ncbi:peptidase M20 [Sphingomonas spermidinifaciens]|uniref:Peptidase M20 n=1 Tax=Sphingomonas spermidinifaciens TaxID=1141889 RepID=A0A2A4B4G4_9SPHN|nr:amidohydrolase [Sphingomonas spermidinifaciens]PCD02679.1 peptidase M20 [Sphingomonas spermidinifaciens]
MIRSLIPLAALVAMPAAAQEPVRDATAAQMPALTALYRDLHANPELAFQEKRSAKLMADAARKAGFTVTDGVGQTGVVAVMKNGPGPTLLIRTDMDGLPVAEATGLPFASKARATTAEGTETAVMHACGHDTHMAGWVGTLNNLARMKDRWSGTLVMIAQPAEERGLGAKAMLDDGLYTRFPKPDVALAFHDSASLPAGTIGVRPGFALATVDSVDLTVRGVGGHGAYPSGTRDPVVLGAKIVMALQTLVSRESDPQSPAVVTVGSFRAGTSHNVIGDEATLLITVRSYEEKTRKLLLDGIARIARGEAIASGVPEDRMPVMTVRPNATPATFNTDPLSGRMRGLFEARFGKGRVAGVPAAMVGEDFSRYYLADKAGVQSLLFWVGGVPQAKWDAAQAGGAALPSLHSPNWAPDAEKVIATAAEAMTAAALDVLKKG